jgi:hypothetical protein
MGMKNCFYLIVLLIGISGRSYADRPVADVLGQGKQPQVSVDNAGVVRVVYGLDDLVFCATSNNHGRTFSKPVLVAHVAGMHLGMGRGPQLASSGWCSVITAMDKTGNIHWFKQSKGSAKWQSMGVVNDLEGSAPEGMMAIAADNKDSFYAVWLDTRIGKRNQICFSSLSAKSKKWLTNRIIYQSPDGHVCECCKPGITVAGGTVAVMFRNWLNGSRDLYTLRSADAGKSYSAAQKMGLSTWKLDGCPMDGGGLRLNALNQIETTWQRMGDIYFAKDADPEIYIGKGKVCSLVSGGVQTMITYQNRDTLKLVSLPGKKTQVIGEGSAVRSAKLKSNQTLFVWEHGDQIQYKTL